MKYLKQAILKYDEELLKKKNVVSVAIGRKIKGANVTDKLCIKVGVIKKEPTSSLRAEDIVPEELRVDGRKIETDVIEVGEISAYSRFSNVSYTYRVENQKRTDRYRPIPPGVSIGNAEITAGTSSFLVKAQGSQNYGSTHKGEIVSGKVESGMIYSLSNAHVYCSNPAKDISAQRRKIVQPGKIDDVNWENNIVGELCKMVLIQPEKPNWVDCALCKPDNEKDFIPQILEIGIPKGVKEPEMDIRVVKSGRSTELTSGIITDINASVRVNYGQFSATFKEQILLSRMSAGGDSGSAIVSEDGYAIGLLFAGSESITVANPIGNVLNALGVELIIEPSNKEYRVDFILEKENTEDGSKIYGYVRSKEGNPIRGADIDLSNASGSHSVTTNALGYFAFFDVPDGSYTISCHKEGYLSQNKEINI